LKASARSRSTAPSDASSRTADLYLPDLYPFQETVLLAPERELVILSATQIGKTFACAVWLLAWLWQHPGKLGWWVAPTLGQSMGDGYETLIALDEKAKARGEPGFIARAVESKRRIYLYNRSRIEFRSWEKREYLRGRTVHAMVVDEAGLLDSASRSILSTRRSATLGPIRYIGNPGPVLGEFWNLCQQAEDEENAGRMRLLRWTWTDRYLALAGRHPAGDTPASLLDVEGAESYRSFIESEKKDLSLFEFEQQYEGKFATPPGALFAEWLDRAMVVPADPNPHPGHPYVTGWDVGQQAGWTRGAHLCLKCWSVQHVSGIKGKPYPMIEQFIADETERFKSNAVIEVNGPGRPVFDHVLDLYKNTTKWNTDNTNKRNAALTVNRMGSAGSLKLADIPVLRSEMTMFKSHQMPTTGRWTFVSPSKKDGHGDCVSALLIAVGAATSGAAGYLLMLNRQIEKAEAAKAEAARIAAGGSQAVN